MSGRHHYMLGIDGLWPEYAALRCPGVYILLADREEHADRLVQGILSTLGPEARADWLATGDKAEKRAGQLGNDRGPGRLDLFGLPESLTESGLQALPEELERMRRWRRGTHRLSVLDIDAASLDRLDERGLGRWLTQLRDWTLVRKVCLVLAVHGERCLALRGRLQSWNDVVDGVAHLQPVGDMGRYLVVHWRSDLRVCGGRDLTLAPHDEGWRLIASMTHEEASGSDEHLVFAQRAALQGAPALSEHWRVFDQPRKVVAQAVNAQSATVILTLESAEDIEPVARWMHGLRVQRGNGVKLVVLELVACLRYRDDRLLTLCGVNMVVGHSVPFSRFLSRLEGVQGQRFGRPVGNDFESLLTAMRPAMPGGPVSPARLVEHVLHWLDGDSAEAATSLLVALHAAGGLSETQALHQCRLSRYGDVVTVMDGQLYLFLFGCRLNDLEPTLQRLFGLPAEALFASRRVLDQRETIDREVQRLIGLGWGEITEMPRSAEASPAAKPGQADVNEAVPALLQPRAEPRPVMLKLTTREAPRA